MTRAMLLLCALCALLEGRLWLALVCFLAFIAIVLLRSYLEDQMHLTDNYQGDR